MPFDAGSGAVRWEPPCVAQALLGPIDAIAQ